MASFIIRGDPDRGASRMSRCTFPMFVVFGKKLHLEIHVHAVETVLRKTQSRNKKAGYNSGTCACTSPVFLLRRRGHLAQLSVRSESPHSTWFGPGIFHPRATLKV